MISVDRNPPRATDPLVDWVGCDLLLDEVDLPAGHVVVLLGGADPRPRWPWTLAWHTPLATARLAHQLRGRTVTLLSSVEVYGEATPPMHEDTEPVLPWGPDEIARWCDEATQLAQMPCPPWRAAALCRRMAEAGPTGRWVYALAKLAQEHIVAEAGAAELTVLRVANAYGLGQERVVSRLVREALGGRPLVVTNSVRSFVPASDIGRVLLADPGPGRFNVGGPPLYLGRLAGQVAGACGSTSPIEIRPRPAADSSGVIDVARLSAVGIDIAPLEDDLERLVAALVADDGPVVEPPLPVVLPPRPVKPDEVADRIQECLWSGALKHGNRWSTELAQRLSRSSRSTMTTSFSSPRRALMPFA